MQDFLDWLQNEDEVSLSARAERLRFLIDEFGDPGHLLFHGGDISLAAFEEMRWCYVNGHFVGCVVLAQVFLEHIWSSFLYVVDEACKCNSFLALLNEIRERKWITAEEYNDLNKLRQNRNPYVHRKGFDHPKHPLRRAMDSNSNFFETTEQDAQHAVRSVFRTLRKYPFRLEADK